MTTHLHQQKYFSKSSLSIRIIGKSIIDLLDSDHLEANFLNSFPDNTIGPLANFSEDFVFASDCLIDSLDLFLSSGLVSFKNEALSFV